MMNNEIKEILDYYKKDAEKFEYLMKDYTEDQLKTTFSRSYQRYRNHKLLLDYITNLQQELEEYKDTETYSKRFLYKANKDRLNANLELVKENERLKTKTKEQSLLLIDYQDMEQKYEDYKSRIEKAVEYIEKSKEINYKTIDTLSEKATMEKGILKGENGMLNMILIILNGKE